MATDAKSNLIEAAAGELREKLEAAGNAVAKSRILKSISPTLWQEFYDHYLGVRQVAKALGIDHNAVSRYLNRAGVRQFKNKYARYESKRWQQLLDMMAERADGIVHERPVLRLNPSHDYAIFGDVHCPAHSEKWLKRLGVVCQHYGITRAISAGDIINFDAISYWAKRERGEVPRVQQELEVYEILEIFLLELFPDGIWLIISNHEMRLLHILKHEIQADYLFERLLRTGKWVDGEVISIGKRLKIYHPSKREWKRPLNQANEYALANECSVILAHTHRFAFAHSDAGRAIGLLGGLFDEKKLRYRTGTLNKYQLQNGFFLWRRGKLIPFCDALTDWELYGCE